MKYVLEKEIENLNKKKLDLPKKQILPDNKILDRYEDILKIKFSDEYRNFIKKVGYIICNGMDNLNLTEDQSSRRDLIKYTEMARELGLPKNWLPIVEDNGDYYCLRPDGKVVFWSHDGSSDEEWESIAAWIHEVWIGSN